jgi:hypothetical protein
MDLAGMDYSFLPITRCCAESGQNLIHERCIANRISKLYDSIEDQLYPVIAESVQAAKKAALPDFIFSCSNGLWNIKRRDGLGSGFPGITTINASTNASQNMNASFGHYTM